MEAAKNKVLTLLGFAQKAGKIVSGSETVEKQLGRPDSKLLLIAKDLSEAYMKQIIIKCENLNQNYILLGTKDELGNAIGKSQRGLVIVKDYNISQAILKVFNSNKQL